MLLTCLMLVAVRLVGETLPASPLALVFSDPDGTRCATPCIFGVRPGETSGEQARLLLGANELTRGGVWTADNVLALPDASSYVTFRVRRDGLVESILLTTSLADDGAAPEPGSLLDSITLGDYMAMFTVTEVAVPLSPYVLFNYPIGGTFASIVRPADVNLFLNPRLPLAHVFVSIPTPCANLDFGAGGPWRGFKTLEYYRSQLTLAHVFPSRMPLPPYRICYMLDNDE